MVNEKTSGTTTNHICVINSFLEFSKFLAGYIDKINRLHKEGNLKEIKSMASNFHSDVAKKFYVSSDIFMRYANILDLYGGEPSEEDIIKTREIKHKEKMYIGQLFDEYQKYINGG